MTTVRTVLGDVDPARLGTCDAHDHLFFRSPALPGQELTDPAAAAAELRAFAAAGGGSVVQWSPVGTDRRADALIRLSRRTGVQVIAATGLHQAAHTDPAVLDRVRGRLTELFVAELTEGIRAGDDPDAAPLPARAGLIKVAGDFHALSAHARASMTAAAEAHHATGAPIAVHHEAGTAAPEVLDLLCGRLGVPADRVVLGHLNRCPDLRMQRDVAASGAYLAFDGPSRAQQATDWRLLDTLTELAAAGHARQLLVGGDTTTAAARASTGGGPGMPFLLRVLRPRIEHALGAAVTADIFVANPARAYAVDWRR
ncbi:hypothetical protein AB0I55_16260 [Actinocatenispora sera]|uniref:phosphotriesterase family protein n=1 Tax=Actinocatenispora sera TaxID=390989 RepID=UPI0034114AA9